MPHPDTCIDKHGSLYTCMRLLKGSVKKKPTHWESNPGQMALAASALPPTHSPYPEWQSHTHTHDTHPSTPPPTHIHVPCHGTGSVVYFKSQWTWQRSLESTSLVRTQPMRKWMNVTRKPLLISKLTDGSRVERKIVNDMRSQYPGLPGWWRYAHHCDTPPCSTTSWGLALHILKVKEKDPSY